MYSGKQCFNRFQNTLLIYFRYSTFPNPWLYLHRS